MELSSINDKLIQGLQRAQVEQVMALSKVLGLKVGSQFLANVEKVTQASPAERTELLKVIETNLAQLNKNSAAPAVKALINQLQAQQALAQTATLKLANLTISLPITTTSTATTAQPINILTFTTQPLQAGQTLLMQLSEGQRLQLLQPLSPKDMATLSTLLSHPTTTNTGISSATEKLVSAIPLLNTSKNNIEFLTQQLPLKTIARSDNLSPPTNTWQAAIKTESINAIGESLRRLLPHQDKGQDLLAQLPKITQFIQQLPIAERKEWLSNTVQQSLKTMANHIRLSEQLNNPKLVEMTLKNNGQSFEQKLAQLIAQPKNSPPLPTPAATNIAALVEKKSAVAPALLTTPTAVQSITGKAQPIAALIHASNTKAPVNHHNIPAKMSVEKVAMQDLKGALLGLLSDLNTELDSAKPTTLGAVLAGDAQKNNALNALPQLLTMLINKQQGELSQKQLRTQLVMLLHQYTLGSLAKIQLQQVHTLNHQLSQADQLQPTQSWQFEIPVRQGQEVHPLSIHMEQQWIEEAQEEGDEKNTPTRARQWNIMLSFNLPIIGPFYAQLTLLNHTLSAKFWSESEHTLNAAKKQTEHLTQQLESQGIRVTNMQCLQGIPPKPKMLLHYSLVDIKT